MIFLKRFQDYFVINDNTELLIPEIEFIGNYFMILDKYLPRKISKIVNYFLINARLILNNYDQGLEFIKYLKCYNKPFIGYEKIYGVKLSTEVFQSLNVDIQSKLAKELGNFLLYIHSFNLEKSSYKFLDYWSFGADYYRSFYHDILQYTLPNLTISRQNLLLEFYNNFLNNPEYYDYCPCLIHGDMRFSNLLFNLEKEQLGIIDFGNLSLGDPDFDFFYLYAYYGKNFCKQVYKHYGKIFTKQIETKFNMLLCCIGSEIVREGEQYNDNMWSQTGWRFLSIFFENLQNF